MSTLIVPTEYSDEVLAAAAAEGKEVGERGVLGGYDAETRRPWPAVDGLEELRELVDEESVLPFAVNGDVRLDAGVPAGDDAAPSRLLD